MTHTLHRRGTKDSLSSDYVVFAIAAQTVNAKGSSEKFKEFFNIVCKFDPVNYGDMKTGNKFSVGEEKLLSNFQDNSIVHAVFTRKDTVIEVLKELKKADLGLSIVVSGLFDEIEMCCKETDLEFHTINCSLNIWGDVDRLPQEKVLEISTMCGHGMVSFNLILDMVDKVKRGKIKTNEAAEKIARQCHCGIVNPVRVEMLLKEFI